MQRENLFSCPADIGSKLIARLKTRADKHDVIGEVRGSGLLIGLEFVSDRRSRRPFPPAVAFTARLIEELRRRNVLVGGGAPGSNHGRDGDHIQISPLQSYRRTNLAARCRAR